MKILLLNLMLITFAANTCWATNDLDFFKESYEECDTNFVAAFHNLKAHGFQPQMHEFHYSQGTIKSIFVPAEERNRNLLVIFSGTHGIEAFAGSAIQRYILNEELKLKKTSLLFVHGLNLFGFINGRRVNENNVDLNRNFVIDRNKFKPTDENYRALNKFLNPGKIPELNFFSRPLFFFESFFNIFVYSIDALRGSILKGQYSFPDGVFYGGKDPEPQHVLLKQLVDNYAQFHRSVFVIDLHTGYGERAKLHLMAGKKAEQNSKALGLVFNPEEIDYADKKNFYEVEGDVVPYFLHLIQQVPQMPIYTAGVTFEYGTLDSQTSLGSIESLRRIVLENQNFHYPAVGDTDEQIKTLFREMFYPSDPVWRASILAQTDVRMKEIFRYLERF